MDSRRKTDYPRIIIALFLVLMMAAATISGINPFGLVNNALVRLFLNGFLVLSLIPMMRAGVGINYGMPVGLVGGLLGMTIALQFSLGGWWGLLAALALAAGIGSLLGAGYSFVLERVAGREEIAGIFCGFSAVYAMCFFWNTGPFDNPALTWPIGGQGLRPVIGLKDSFGGLIDKLWMVKTGQLELPLGALLIFGLCAGGLYLFFKSRPGLAIDAVGENPEYAELNGVSVRRARRLAVILSMAMAAVGICIYAQSYGFLELYEAPLMMAFPAASAVLLGGAGGRRAGIGAAIAGVFLFQSVYIVSGPLANQVLVPELSEIIRTMLTSGIILYALLQDRKAVAQ